MNVQFPVDRVEKRGALLKAVDSVREILLAHAKESEVARTLSPASVAALTDSGLFAMKCPAELGGAEADPVTQIEVIEATSYIDASAGWCLAICNGGLAIVGSLLPQPAVGRVFAGDRPPRIAGSTMAGTAIGVDGGYRISGNWSWASGIHHAEWLLAITLVEADGGNASYPRMTVFPASQAKIHDNWHVSGLEGTGSSDFSVSDLFVPEAFTIDLRKWEPKRGGPLYQLGRPGLVINELAGFALGVARRALDGILNLAKTKRRGYGKQKTLAEREVFQRAIGEGDLRFRAARGLVIEIFDNAWHTVCAGKKPGPELQIEMRSVTTLVTDVALDITTLAFRYGAGSAIHLSSILQRCLRDLQAGAAHLMVSDASYELHGQCLLGIADVDPLA